ncbi:MAG TPA: ABC transporter permease [Bryobacteraceae bacterium]|nr:ABC transporter permease [Bryobacteraceae bacterium]
MTPSIEHSVRHTNRLWLATNAFGATLRRDLAVTRRELPQFLIQALIQPMFFLLIFCKIMPSIGLTAGNFASLMLPGIIGLTELMAAIQGITLPLVLDLGFAREIDDRLLAPQPVWLVAAEKMLFAAMRGVAAGAVIFPAAWLVLGSRYAVRGDRIGILIGMIVLAAFAGSGIGLVIGTVVKPEQISLMFSIILTPLLFLGCTYYPWGALHTVRWFQVLTLFNPLTYAAEGLRYAMVPPVNGRELPTLPVQWVLLALVATTALCFGFGARTFRSRVVS